MHRAARETVAGWEVGCRHWRKLGKSLGLAVTVTVTIGRPGRLLRQRWLGYRDLSVFMFRVGPRAETGALDHWQVQSALGFLSHWQAQRQVVMHKKQNIGTGKGGVYRSIEPSSLYGYDWSRWPPALASDTAGGQ